MKVMSRNTCYRRQLFVLEADLSSERLREITEGGCSSMLLAGERPDARMEQGLTNHEDSEHRLLGLA